MAKVNGSNETFYSNYPIAPDGVVRTEAPIKKHPLVSGQAAGPAVTRAIDVGGSDKDNNGVGTNPGRKIT